MKRTTSKKPMQTAAVYCEPRIRTYGFHVVTDLCFMGFLCESEQLAALGRGIEELGDVETGFTLVFGQTSKDHVFSLFVLAHERVKGKIGNHMQRLLKGEDLGPLELPSPVEVVSFQGPHFGDRYGIAHAVFSALQSVSMPLLAAVCSTACVYLVFPQGKGGEAKRVLEGTFELPGIRRAKKNQGEGKQPCVKPKTSI